VYAITFTHESGYHYSITYAQFNKTSAYALGYDIPQFLEQAYSFCLRFGNRDLCPDVKTRGIESQEDWKKIIPVKDHSNMHSNNWEYPKYTVKVEQCISTSSLLVSTRFQQSYSGRYL